MSVPVSRSDILEGPLPKKNDVRSKTPTMDGYRNSGRWASDCGGRLDIAVSCGQIGEAAP